MGLPLAIAGGAALTAAGGIAGAGLDYKTGKKNIALQREFAKYGISWKVADAKRAGIHPLAALGANTISFRPIRTGAGQTIARSMGQMGQGIQKAAVASSEIAQGAEMTKLRLEEQVLINDGRLLDNMIKNGQLAGFSTSKGFDTPSFTGQPVPNTGAEGVETQKNPVPHITANVMTGIIPTHAWQVQPDGSYRLLMNQQLGESLERDLVNATGMGIDTAKRIVASWKQEGPKPYWKPKPGHYWKAGKTGYWFQHPIVKTHRRKIYKPKSSMKRKTDTRYNSIKTY